jgi:mannose-6-phosphate isomerase-like protein (cupin superfamily)
MPVAHVADEATDARTRPAWSRSTAVGILRVDSDHPRFDRHYHDCDEYWLIFAGTARV